MSHLKLTKVAAPSSPAANKFVVYVDTADNLLKMMDSAGLVQPLSGYDFAEVINAAKGVKFPATQVASSDVNTLDDYEEGLWTPTFGGTTSESGQAYSIQLGRYVKIGKLVIVQFYVALSTLGTITGNVMVKGLPFTSENVSNLYAACTIGFWSGMTVGKHFLTGFCSPNSSGITLEATASAVVASAVLAQGDLSATTNMLGTMSYRTS